MKPRLVQLIQLLRTHSLKLAPPGDPFTLVSGKKSDFYLDVKKTALLPQGHALLGQMFFDLLPWDTSAVAGVALGGCSLASAVSMYSASRAGGIPAVYVRKEAKAHGTGQFVESPIDLHGGRVVLLEDVVTSGGSSLRAVHMLQQAGATVIGVYAVVDRLEGAKEEFAVNSIRFQSLTTIQDILQPALEPVTDTSSRLDPFET